MIIKIRKAELKDYEAVEAIMQQVQMLHVGFRPDIYKETDCVLPVSQFEKMIEDGNVVVAENYISENNTAVVGIMFLESRHVEQPVKVTRDTLYIDTLAVDEKLRGQGIGHLLMNEAVKTAKQMKMDGLELQVNGNNTEALKFYRDYGFGEKTLFMDMAL